MGSLYIFREVTGYYLVFPLSIATSLRHRVCFHIPAVVLVLCTEKAPPAGQSPTAKQAGPLQLITSNAGAAGAGLGSTTVVGQ